MKNLLKKLSIFEIVAYSVLLALGLWGFIYTILGFSCKFISVHTGLRKADAYLKSTFGTGFLVCGLIVMGVAVVAAVIVLLVNAKKSDRDFEKAQRRASRLKKKPEVVDASSSPVEETSKED